MAKYHINPETGNANVCTARVKCKFTSDDGVEPPHYGSKIEAMRASEEQLSGSLPTIQTLKNDVAVQAPVGDRRSEEQLSEEITEKSVNVQEYKERYTSGIRSYSSSVGALDKAVLRGDSHDSSSFKEAYNASVQTVNNLDITRRELLTERAQLNEDRLILEQKQNPDRTAKRAAVLEGLNPGTKEGRELVAEMKKALEHSEKELTKSKKATDNLHRRNQTEPVPGSSYMKSTFANVNDFSEQSNRMVKHARALRKLSELSERYEKAEAHNWRVRVGGDLTELKATENEKGLADTQTPHQLTAYLRLTKGIDMKHLRERFIKTLERDRSKLPKGPSDKRDRINAGLRDHRAFVKNDEQQYKWGINEASDTNGYKGYIGLD